MEEEDIGSDMYEKECSGVLHRENDEYDAVPDDDDHPDASLGTESSNCVPFEEEVYFHRIITVVQMWTDTRIQRYRRRRKLIADDSIAHVQGENKELMDPDNFEEAEDDEGIRISVSRHYLRCMKCSKLFKQKKSYDSHFGGRDVIVQREIVIGSDVTKYLEMFSTGFVNTYNLIDTHPMLEDLQIQNLTKKSLTFQPV